VVRSAPELIRLADLAAARIVDLALREQLAENLIAALTDPRRAAVRDRFRAGTATGRGDPRDVDRRTPCRLFNLTPP
jgi:hypothetical protein